MRAQRESGFVGDVAEWETGQYRNLGGARNVVDDGGEVVAGVVHVADGAHAEIAEDDGALFLQNNLTDKAC